MRAAALRLERKLDQLAQQCSARALLRLALEEVAWLAPDAPRLDDFMRHVDTHRAGEVAAHYSAIVVLMYGAFEQFIEESVVEFVEELNRIVPTFQELPDGIRGRHVDLSANVLLARRMRKYEQRIREVDILQNLLSCAQGGSGYRLNAMAFAYHTSNLRIGLVSELFAQIDVSGVTGRIRGDATFREIAASRAGAEIERQPDAVVFRDLDDIAERRNDVAHGEPGSILSDAELSDVIEYVRGFARALVLVLEGDLLRREIDYRGTALASPVKVYGNRIVCFAETPVEIAKGHWLAIRSLDGRVECGRILGIQVDGSDREAIAPGGGEAFGLSVGFHVKENHQFFVLAR